MALNFKKDKYCIIPKAISKQMAEIAYDYIILKRRAAETLFKTKYIIPFEKMHGTWDDDQVPRTFSIYGDVLMDTLLEKCLPIAEKHSKLKLIPNYSYCRIYKKGDVLRRHKDRFSCEVSATLNLGGDEWPIYINPDPKGGYTFGRKEGLHKVQDYKPSKDKGVKIILKPGAMLLYRGIDLEHWREAFDGANCGQVFFHYNDYETKGSEKNLYDGRPHLGLPPDIKRVGWDRK